MPVSARRRAVQARYRLCGDATDRRRLQPTRRSQYHRRRHRHDQKHRRRRRRQFGYDWQWGHLVAGGELDLSYTDLSGTRVATVRPVPNTLHQDFTSHFFATVRGRIGYAHGPWLVYATGGLALADLIVSDFATSTFAGTAQSSSHELRPGWTAGGGVEWMVMPRWSMRWSISRRPRHAHRPARVFRSRSRSRPDNHRFTENLLRFGLLPPALAIVARMAP